MHNDKICPAHFGVMDKLPVPSMPCFSPPHPFGHRKITFLRPPVPYISLFKYLDIWHMLRISLKVSHTSVIVPLPVRSLILISIFLNGRRCEGDSNSKVSIKWNSWPVANYTLIWFLCHAQSWLSTWTSYMYCPNSARCPVLLTRPVIPGKHSCANWKCISLLLVCLVPS